MWLWLACTNTSPIPTDSDGSSEPDEVPWVAGLPGLASELDPVRGYLPRRTIVHLHSPWSHDACDGDPQPDGTPNAECLADLRQGLCTAHVDVAFLSDHPAYAAEASFDELFLSQEGDVREGRMSTLPCEDGHEVRWLPGIEDELMPVGLHRHVAETAEENDRLYNNSDSEAMDAMHAAEASIFQAHTEGRDTATLMTRQDEGLAGIEVFNLHAMFAPDIRTEDLGLGAMDWIEDIGPFTNPEATGEPDLLFLGVLQHQEPSLERWNALLARGPMAGVAGSDSHQNVLPLDLRDGERGDSYRRTFRWFSNVLLAGGDDADSYQEALEKGRLYVAFHVLGIPDGFDFRLEADGSTYEMGSEAPPGTLVVSCPTLSSGSPRGPEDPEIAVRVLRDGVVWKSECGQYEVDAGVYRVEVDIVPHHLEPFLGDDPAPWLRPFPWVYGNAIRVVAR